MQSILKNITSLTKWLNLNCVKVSRYANLANKNTLQCIENNDFNLKTKLNDGFIQFELFTRNNLYVKEFPYIWLRDHCKCPKCFNTRTEENEFDLSLIPLNIKPVNVKTLDNNNLEIIWDDGHKSEYDMNRMKNYIYEEELNKINKKNKKFLWNTKILNEHSNGFKRIEYDSYMNNESAFKDALKAILTYGAVLIQNVPSNNKEIAKISNRIGPIVRSIDNRNSNDDNTDCVVVTDSLEISDRAYSSLALRAHNDSIYLKNGAGIEAFHMIKKAKEGGHSNIIDGFYCANQLKENFRDDYETLTNLIVEFEENKANSHKISYKNTVIELDPINGEMTQIRYNPIYNIKLNHLNKNQIFKFYKAMQNLIRLVQNSNNEYWIDLNPDQVLIFDNYRLLHGRSAINGGNRTLMSSYLNRDDWLIRCSKLKLI